MLRTGGNMLVSFSGFKTVLFDCCKDLERLPWFIIFHENQQMSKVMLCGMDGFD